MMNDEVIGEIKNKILWGLKPASGGKKCENEMSFWLLPLVEQMVRNANV